MPDENYYRLHRGDELLVERLLSTVSRSILSKLERQFKIPIPRFFPPRKSLSVVKPPSSIA